MINDLRDFIRAIDEMGELVHVKGAHWNLEIGAICELWGSDAQALLFDEIQGYPKGYRVLTNALNSPSRITLAAGLPPVYSKLEAVRALREKMRNLTHIPPVEVKDGPVLQNVMVGHDIDLFKFPTPFWHELDGGRYIATGSACVTRDPDTGWVNVGTYRAMIHDKNSTGIAITYGHHGLMIMQKYWAQGKPCPIAIAVGQDPALYMAAGTEVPYGVSEYDVAGGLRGAPIEVVQGPMTGLPIPAHAELVIEGEISEHDLRDEGPHGEWAGYYASGVVPRHVVRVKSVCYRNDPIILGGMPGKPPSDNTYFLSPFKSAAIWDELEKAGVPEVHGVWEHECGGGRMFLAVAVKQLYPGHSKQAGHVASYCHQGAYANRIVVVVDEDVDVTNLEEVMWAVCTRADFRWGIDFSHRNWTSPLDTTHYPEEEDWHVFNSRMIIDACRPWERRKTFPPVAAASRKLREKIFQQWGELFAQRRNVLHR